MMLTSKIVLRARASFVTAGVAGLLSGCFIDAKIGDDPESGSAGTTDSGDEGESTTTVFPGEGSGSASATSTTSTTGGEPSASATATGPGPNPVDQDTALELCGVEVVPIEPGGPEYYEGVECSEGCSIDIQTSVPSGIYEHGECLCEAIACGEPIGGTTSEGGDVPTDTETDTETGETDGDPDGCGPFPDGNAGFTCSCEMCSIDVNDVDAAWLDGEADLEAICECMCGGAGCGAPV